MQLMQVTTVLILWYPLCAHLQKHMKFMQKNTVFLGYFFYRHYYFNRQNVISKSASCICRKHNSSNYLDQKKNQTKTQT